MRRVARLRSRELEVARAVAATLFHRGARGAVPEERLAFYSRELQAYARSLTTLASLALHAALLGAQLSPLIFGIRAARLTRCSPEERARALHALETGRLGLAMVLLKVTSTLLYFEHPAALAETGFDGIGRQGPAFADGGRSPLEPLP